MFTDFSYSHDVRSSGPIRKAVLLSLTIARFVRLLCNTLNVVMSIKKIDET